MNEIERKFLVSTLPDTPILKRYKSERYLLESDEGHEERITHTGDKYFYERKLVLSDLERTRDKREISESEFDELKGRAYGKLIRETILINNEPKTVIQIYKDDYDGLIRAEVEFESQEEANSFTPHKWMSREITGSEIARDSSLVKMSRDKMLTQIDV